METSEKTTKAFYLKSFMVYIACSLLFSHVSLHYVLLQYASHLSSQSVIKPSCSAYKEATGKECMVQIITENFLPDEW